MDLYQLLNITLVQYVGKNLHILREEISRWRIILEIPYQEYLNNQTAN